jgi:hypothetical protein
MAAFSLAIPFSASATTLSHPLKLSLTFFSRLLITLDMASTSDYRKAYDSAKRELTDLLAKQEEIAKRTLVVRKSIETLASLCESEGVQVEPSVEATYLLENSNIADEVRAIFRVLQSKPLRPNEVMNEFAKLGHSLEKYQNPQAVIHMVIKRMVDSGELKESTDSDGKKVYSSTKPSRMAQMFRQAAKNRIRQGEVSKPYEGISPIGMGDIKTKK